MNRIRLHLLICLVLASCSFENTKRSAQEKDVERIMRFLSADDVQGRAVFTPGIDKAARFIDEEFRTIGLKPIDKTDNYLQQFAITRIKPGNLRVTINGKKVLDHAVIGTTDLEKVKIDQRSDIEILSIKAGKNLVKLYEKIIASNNSVLVLVDSAYTNDFKQLRSRGMKSRAIEQGQERAQVAVFVLGITRVESFEININNLVERSLLSNVVGMIPGRSRAHELVIFSAHYDHLGVIKPNSIKEYLKAWRISKLGVDSIANGADDNASGVTAIISLANYYKNLNNNERTLIFVAFTAEEIGGFGSRYFIEKLDPSSVMAMFNIEMVGKQSKFGKNSAFITGYEKSDLGSILQRNLLGTQFKFYPDPYPEQDLFNRSDNASLAALGIPAHTISTDRIDIDQFYHTVKDEYQTLDISNITATINAIALSSKSIIRGKDTPSRIPVFTME